jgi:hypothetical protein
LIVISTDPPTEARAERWIDEQRRGRPELECLHVKEPEGEEFFSTVHEAVERHRPDAVIMVRHGDERRGLLEGTYGALKDDLAIPVDAIYTDEDRN